MGRALGDIGLPIFRHLLVALKNVITEDHMIHLSVKKAVANLLKHCKGEHTFLTIQSYVTFFSISSDDIANVQVSYPTHLGTPW